jgi:polyhydroxyalkanoate synthesis regulator phasin
LDATARSRCLLVLSVLSGEKSVTQAIEQAAISRGLYYQLESRALSAMISALTPRSARTSSRSAELAAATARIAQLQRQVQRLQREKRRAQRLLLLTRKTIRASVKTNDPGAWPRSSGEPARLSRVNRSPLSIARRQPSDAPSSTEPGVPSR